MLSLDKGLQLCLQCSSEERWMGKRWSPAAVEHFKNYRLPVSQTLGSDKKQICKHRQLKWVPFWLVNSVQHKSTGIAPLQEKPKEVSVNTLSRPVIHFLDLFALHLILTLFTSPLYMSCDWRWACFLPMVLLEFQYYFLFV